MPQPNRNPSTNDPDRFERERSDIEREPSSVADDRPARRRNRVLEEDPPADDADVMPETASTRGWVEAIGSIWRPPPAQRDGEVTFARRRLPAVTPSTGAAYPPPRPLPLHKTAAALDAGCRKIQPCRASIAATSPDFRAPRQGARPSLPTEAETVTGQVQPELCAGGWCAWRWP